MTDEVINMQLALAKEQLGIPDGYEIFYWETEIDLFDFDTPSDDSFEYCDSEYLSLAEAKDYLKEKRKATVKVPPGYMLVGCDRAGGSVNPIYGFISFKAKMEKELLDQACGLLWRLNEYGYINNPTLWDDDAENQADHFANLARDIVKRFKELENDTTKNKD